MSLPAARFLSLSFVVPFVAVMATTTGIVTSGESKTDAPSGIRVLQFGVYTSEKATEMYRTFAPILDAASEFLSTKLKSRIDFEIRIGRNYDQSIQDLAAGRIDLARFGPASYITARNIEPGIQIVAMEVKDGKKTFDGVIVTRKDSPVRSLGDLRGRAFAFGDPNSTIGRYLVQEALAGAGIHQHDLSKVAFIDRHDKVATAVLYGQFDAGAVKEDTFVKFKDKDPGLREISRLKNVTKPWLARKGLDPAMVIAMREFLLQFKDPDALKQLESMTGFVEGAGADYEPIQRAMAASEMFSRD